MNEILLFIAGLTIGLGVGLIIGGIREYILTRRESKN